MHLQGNKHHFDENDIFKLDVATAAPYFPRKWLTVPQFRDELEANGFWADTTLAASSAEEREAWLDAVFRTVCDGLEQPGLPAGIHVWPRIGSQFKHTDLLTAADHQALAEWHSANAEACKAEIDRRFGKGA